MLSPGEYKWSKKQKAPAYVSPPVESYHSLDGSPSYQSINQSIKLLFQAAKPINTQQNTHTQTTKYNYKLEIPYLQLSI